MVIKQNMTTASNGSRAQAFRSAKSTLKIVFAFNNEILHSFARLGGEREVIVTGNIRLKVKRSAS